MGTCTCLLASLGAVGGHLWIALLPPRNINLKNKSQLFYVQNGFIQEQQRIAIRDLQLLQNHRPIPQTGEERYFMEKKGEWAGGALKAVPLEKSSSG